MMTDKTIVVSTNNTLCNTYSSDGKFDQSNTCNEMGTRKPLQIVKASIKRTVPLLQVLTI
jgi:hypothetical protein